MNHSKIYLIGLILILISYSMNAQNFKTFEGEIGTKHYLAGTHTFKENFDVKDMINDYLPKMNLLRDYFHKINLGKELEAENLLKQDKELAETDSFTLGLTFGLARMFELGILYKPCPSLHTKEDESIFLVCSEKQFNELDYFDLNAISLRVKCKYIGDFIMDGILVYELISYEEIKK